MFNKKGTSQDIESDILYKVNCSPDNGYTFLKNILVFAAVIWLFNKSLDYLFVYNSYFYAIMFFWGVLGGLYSISVDIRSSVLGGFNVFKDRLQTFSGRSIAIEDIYFQLEALGYESVLSLKFFEKVDDRKYVRLLKCRHTDLGEKNLSEFVEVLSNISGRAQKDFGFEGGVSQKLGAMHPLIKKIQE